MSFEQRISVPDVDPEAYKPMIALEKYIHAESLGEPLLSMAIAAINVWNRLAVSTHQSLPAQTT